MRKVRASLAVSIAALLITGCGGSSSTSSTTGTLPVTQGTIYTFLRDTPACGVLGLHLLISQITLTDAAGGTANLIGVNAVSIPNVELTSLQDSAALINVSSLGARTWVKAVLSVDVTQMAVYDPSQNPPIQAFPFQLKSATISAPLVPPLVLQAGKVNAIEFDIDLSHALETDASGNITGGINLLGTAKALTASGSQGFEEMDDARGFVRSVTSQPISGTAFQGSFLFQTLSGTGPAMNVDLTNSTDYFDGASAVAFNANPPGTPQPIQAGELSKLLTDSYAEVDAHVDAQGNLVANSVQIGDQADLSTNKLVYVGPILSVVRDASGNVTQFVQETRDVEPSTLAGVTTDGTVRVYVTPSTSSYIIFNPPNPPPGLIPPELNFPGLTFALQNLAPGEEVATSGVFTANPPALTAVTANEIALRLQTIEGQFGSLITAESDDRTGAFNFTLCSPVFGTVPAVVVTGGNTNFLNVSGLSQLAPQPQLLVRGLAFYEPQSVTLNGAVIPAGTLVIVAKQVHQLL